MEKEKKEKNKSVTCNEKLQKLTLLLIELLTAAIWIYYIKNVIFSHKAELL